MSIPAGLAVDLERLNAPQAKKLREAWGIGTSGARITIAEAERLYALAGAQLHATVDLGLAATKAAGEQIARRNEARKTRAKAQRQAKKGARR